MKINFDFNVIIYCAATSIGLFSSVLLFSLSKNKTANRLLALLMLAITGWIIDAFFRAAGVYGQYPTLYFLPIYYSFGFEPLVYFYVKAITNASFKLKPTDFLHFIPVIIQALFYWTVTFMSYRAKYNVWFNIHQPYTYRIEYDGTWLSLVLYLTFAIVHLKHYRVWLKANYSNLSKKMLGWLYASLFILILVCITWLFEAYLRDFKNTYYRYDVSTNLLCGVIYCIGVLGIMQAGTTLYFDPAKEIDKPLPTAIADEKIVARLETAMQADKLYLNPELSLADLARHINLPPKLVSFNINAAFDKPFNTYVNTYRVQEVKTRLLSNDVEKFTLLGIAFESGFNSKTSLGDKAIRNTFDVTFIVVALL